MITYTELTEAVAKNLEINNTDIDKYNVLASLNSAQWTLINTLPFDFIANAISLTRGALTANRPFYQWPPDFVRFVQAWVSYTSKISDSNRGVPLTEYKSDHHFKPMAEIGTTNFPFINNHIEGGYEIRPAPTADQASGILLRYVWKLPDIAVLQDCLLDINLKNLLVFRATALSAIIDNYRPDLGALFDAKFETGLSRFLPKEEKP